MLLLCSYILSTSLLLGMTYQSTVHLAKKLKLSVSVLTFILQLLLLTSLEISFKIANTKENSLIKWLSAEH